MPGIIGSSSLLEKKPKPVDLALLNGPSQPGLAEMLGADGGMPMPSPAGGFGAYGPTDRQVPQMGPASLIRDTSPTPSFALMGRQSVQSNATIPGGMNAGSGTPPDPMKLDPSQSLSALDSFHAARIKPHFFDKDGTGTKVLRGLGEFALQWSASNGDPGALMMLRNRYAQQQDAREEVQWQRRHTQERQEAEQDRLARLNDPQYFMAGRDRVKFDPSTNQASVVYSGPSDAEDYAAGMGFQPGTPEYQRAMQDYTLKGWGPTAYEGRNGLEGMRQSNRLQLRSMPTFAQAHPRAPAPRAPRAVTPSSVFGPLLAKQAAGISLTPAEQQTLGQYGGRGRGGRGAAGGGSSGGATAIGPNGHKLVVQGGKWVDTVTGKPVG
jgi:hypothetical protein